MLLEKYTFACLPHISCARIYAVMCLKSFWLKCCIKSFSKFGVLNETSLIQQETYHRHISEVKMKSNGNITKKFNQ